MKQAEDAGIVITTLDTPPVDDTVSLIYIGTDNFTAGQEVACSTTSFGN